MALPKEPRHILKVFLYFKNTESIKEVAQVSISWNCLGSLATLTKKYAKLIVVELPKEPRYTFKVHLYVKYAE